MKAPCMSKEQYKGIHDVVNGQGFAMHCRATSKTRSAIWKQKDGLTSLLMLSVLEAKIILQYGFLEEHT